MAIQAEYLWIDGTEPTAILRSKTKILPGPVDDLAELPIWGFDGSSTNQAEGHSSDCVLRPVFMIPDPIRGGDNVIVLNEVLDTDMTPHPSNTRAQLVKTARKYAHHESWFGIEQEYTFMTDGRPYGWPTGGFPAPQGGYYCGVGSDEIWGRAIVEAHTQLLLDAGIAISGTNAEVMMGQWEYQIGPLGPLEVADQLWVWPAGCCIASPRTSMSLPLCIPSRSGVTGTGLGRIPTSQQRPCVRDTTPSLLGAKRWHRGELSTSPSTEQGSSSVLRVSMRPPQSRSTHTECPTVEHRCESHGR